MGKWTTDYYDDVLNAKIKSLVAGAIKRAKFEKTEPTISYQSFVEELDAGDAFTTSVIDVLVKELAERRMRPTLSDRRSIADRTAKSLRTLTTTLRIYRDRSIHRPQLGRRSVNATENLSAPPDEADLNDDDDEFDGLLDLNAIEGHRDSTDLYESYGTHSWVHPSSLARRAHLSFSATLEDPSSTSPSHPPSISPRSPWSLPPGASTSLLGSSLTRQPSFRRPSRSRTVDFNDFTSRRRTTIRESFGSRSDINDNQVSEPSSNRDGPFRSTQSARRFFPFSRSRHHDVVGNLPWTDSFSGEVTDEPGLYLPVEPSSSGTWLSLPAPLSSISPPDIQETETSDERAQSATPRLRRGGIRAPESMLSRHASPVTVAPVSTSPLSDTGANDGRTDGDVAAYPTPGSTENENTSW